MKSKSSCSTPALKCKLRLVLGSFFLSLGIFSPLALQARLGASFEEIRNKVKEAPLDVDRKQQKAIWLLGENNQVRYTVYFDNCWRSIYEEIKPNGNQPLNVSVIEQFLKAQQETLKGKVALKEFKPGETITFNGKKMTVEQGSAVYLARDQQFIVLVAQSPTPHAAAISQQWASSRETVTTNPPAPARKKKTCAPSF